MDRESDRFKYNMSFELAMANLLGKKYYGSAGLFRDAKINKIFLLRAVRRIRRRIDEIVTTDERLLLTTSIVLERLEEYTKTTSESINNDWLIIANLLKLVSLLLGYDWGDGNPHRNVIFYQNENQEIQDYEMKKGRAFWDEFPWGDWRIRFELVSILKKQGLSNNQIARVLKLSDKLVAKILRRIKEFEDATGRQFLEHSTELEKEHRRFFLT